MRYLLALPVLLLTGCVSGSPVDPTDVLDPRCTYTYHLHATEAELYNGVRVTQIDSTTVTCFGLRHG